MTEDDLLLHMERTVATVKADATQTRPGTRVTLEGGGNRLTIESTGPDRNDKKLFNNDVEVVLSTTLKAYAQSVLMDNRAPVADADTATMYWAGAGSLTSPLEAIPKIPVASEANNGVVKVVNEGSHGYPCPGFGGQNFYVGHISGDNYYQLRNGADDLEQDVFITEIKLSPWSVTPTANRFRPKNLPPTAKPIAVRHGNEDCLWLDTTDGSFILLTGGSKDYNAWRCLKITNSDMALGYYGYPHYYNGKIYVIHSVFNSTTSNVSMFEATVTAGNSLTFTKRTLTGNNANGTAQNSQVFKLFDVVKGVYPSTKCMMSNKDGFYTSWTPSIQRDQLVQFRKNGQVRVAHINSMQADGAQTYIRGIMPITYVIDLVSGVIIPDNPEVYPIVVSEQGYSHVNPRGFLSGAGGLSTLCAVIANGYVFTHDTYESYSRPMLRALTPTGMDAYESLSGDNQFWARVGGSVSIGMYASPIEARPRSPKPLAGNKIMVEVPSVGTVIAEYDPTGSYGPNTKGYGPSNNRKIVPTTLSTALAKTCWIFDGENIVRNGGWLSKENLTTYTTYENDVFGSEISMTQAYYDTLLQRALDTYASETTPSTAEPLVDAVLSLMIHRVPGVPMLGMLQVSRKANIATGRMASRCYVFKISTPRLAGTIDSVTLGELLTRRDISSSMKSYSPSANRAYYVSAHLYRLKDNAWVVAIGGVHEGYVSSSNSPSFGYVFDAAGVALAYQYRGTNGTTGIIPFGTKELGYGNMYTEPSAEGMYLDSFGFTSADVVKGMNGQATPVRNIVVLSRTDAGDNVAVSQQAVTDVRTKVLSLVPPTRKVQGMDLSQDRTITKAMLANADKIPNQRDSTYPVQQRHRLSLDNYSLKTHTHLPGEFQMAAATAATFGASILGGMASPDASAFRVEGLSTLEDACDALFSRPTLLNKIDMSLTVDFEV